MIIFDYNFKALSNRNKYLGDARITQAPPPVLKTVRADDDSPKQVSKTPAGKKTVFLPKSVEAIKDLIPNAYQQQLLIVKVLIFIFLKTKPNLHCRII